MKTLVQSIFKKLLLVVAGGIITLAMMISFVRGLTPYLQAHIQSVEQLVQNVIKQPTRIASVETSWSGFGPVIRLKGVRILNDNPKPNLINIDKVDFGINLWHSLLHWRIAPGSLFVSGVNLTVRQANTGKITIDGLDLVAHHSSEMNTSKLIGDVVTWFSNGSQIRAQNLNILWIGHNKRVLPFSATSLNWNNQGDKHFITGETTLSQTIATHLHFVFQLAGSLNNTDTLNGRLYLQAKDLLPGQWLKKHSAAGIHLTSGRLAIENWITITRGMIAQVHTIFTGKMLNLSSDVTKQSVLIKKAQGNFAWSWNNNGWQAIGNDIHINIHGHDWPRTSFALFDNETKSNSPQYTFKASFLRLQDISSLLSRDNLYPATFTNLDNVNMTGDLYDVYASSQKVYVKFLNVGFNKDKKALQLTGLDGELLWMENQGTLHLRGKKIDANVSKAYSHPLSIQALNTNINWSKQDEDWLIQVPVFRFNDHSIRAEGGGNIRYSSSNSPQLNLHARVSAKDINHLKSYVPDRLVEPEFNNWVQHDIHRSEDIVADILLRGSLADFPYDRKQGEFVIKSVVKNADLSYDQHWPGLSNLSATLTVQGRKLSASIEQGTTLHAEIKHATLTMENVTDYAHSPLVIQGDLKSNFTNALKFVQQTPLQETVGKELQGLQFNGPIDLALGLSIPLNPTDPVKVTGATTFQEASLKIPAWNLAINNLHGKFNFTEDSVAANAISGELFSEPLQLDLKTVKSTNNESFTQANITGSLDVNKLQQHLPNLNQDTLTGKTNYSGVLKLMPVTSQQSNTLELRSDLKGIQVNLPLPLQKPKQTSVPSRILFSFRENSPMQLFTHYGKNILSSAITLHEQDGKTKLDSGEIRIATGDAQFQQQPGLVLTGKLKTVDLNDWFSYLKMDVPNAKKSFFRKINLDIHQLKVMGQYLNNCKIDFIADELAGVFKIKSNNVSGEIIVPVQTKDIPIRAHFDNLMIKSPHGNSGRNIKPTDIPMLDIIANNFSYSGMPLGKLDLRVEPVTNGLNIEQFAISNEDFLLNSAGSWRIHDGQTQTHWQGDFNAPDVNAALKKIISADVVDGRDGKIDFNLNWPGDPNQIQLEKLQGTIDLHMGEGIIKNVDPEMNAKLGVGRFLTLFSLQTLVRRIRLDFSDLTEQGFSFDGLNGKFDIANGKASMKNTTCDGPVARVDLNGDLLLKSQTYDLKMTVFPHLTSSLPVVAAIVGGPVAGVITWAVDKIVGNEVGKITEHNYHVSGPWHNPEIKAINGKNR